MQGWLTKKMKRTRFYFKLRHATLFDSLAVIYWVEEAMAMSERSHSKNDNWKSFGGKPLTLLSGSNGMCDGCVLFPLRFQITNILLWKWTFAVIVVKFSDDLNNLHVGLSYFVKKKLHYNSMKIKNHDFHINVLLTI